MLEIKDHDPERLQTFRTKIALETTARYGPSFQVLAQLGRESSRAGHESVTE